MRSKLQRLSCGFSRSHKQQNKQEVGLSYGLLWLAVLSVVELVGCLGLMGRAATNKEERSPVLRELQASYVCW